MAALCRVLLLAAGCWTGCYCLDATVLGVQSITASAPATVLLLRTAAALGFCLLLRFAYQQLRMYLLSRHIPGPYPTLPLLGNILQISMPQEDLMGAFMSMRELYGSTWRLWVGPNLGIFICEPDDLREAFSHEHLQNKAPVYEAMVPLMGRGLLSIDFPAYRRHRKALTPSLHLDVLKSFIPRFGLHGKQLAENTLKPLAQSGRVFDALDVAEHFVCSSLCDTVMCSDMEHFQGEFDKLCACIQPGSNLIMYLGLRPWFRRSELCFRLLSPGKHYEKNKLSAVLHNLVVQLIDRKVAQLQERAEKQSEPTQPGVIKELLEHILTSKEGALMDRDELIGEMKHVLVAGIATSSDLMALIMFCLAMQPEVQERVHQELDEVFADDPTRPVTAADLPQLKYLEMTIKEVMRYFPLVPLYARRAAEDVTLPSGTMVPQGSMVMIFPKAVHWDPRWYPNPTEFDPERFTPEVADLRPNFTFIPFGAGTRVCIGQRYGMMFAKTSVATFLREYRFLRDPNCGVQSLKDVKLIIGMSVQVKTGVTVRVEPRRRS